jgi:hypothetical protein
VNAIHRAGIDAMLVFGATVDDHVGHGEYLPN